MLFLASCLSLPTSKQGDGEGAFNAYKTENYVQYNPI